MTNQVNITTEYITLGQLLKEVGLIDTGGMAKWFLSEHDVLLNGQLENRRGKKIYNNDIVEIPNVGTFEIVSS
ncbi:S4 domain-containing protein YaaA [Anaerobacillus sp. MEB173]|uniref:S4 domain-containing protein YaaA n=1 Tax=Anaerobacillus sp. MEB173 TaxID=3383345 RepID=UPI003F933F51